MQFADINDLTVIANEIKDRANKVSGATNGNFAALDSNGDLTDSGHKHSDYLTQHQDISGKADLDENGKLVSSQKPSYTKSEVGLGNVDNTSDATKKSNFTGSIASGNTGFVTGGDAYTELAKKVDKVDGKGLSTNDYTTTEKDKLAGIATGAEVNVQSDWNQTTNTADDYIKNKPANLVQDASYVHTDNNYTSDEKTKLSGIAEGAEVNVQSDWDETDDTQDDYIKNKPEAYDAIWQNNDILEDVSDMQPYLYRATNKPEGAIEYVQEKLIGASAAVNQFIKNGNFSTQSEWSGLDGGSYTVSNNIAAISCPRPYSGLQIATPQYYATHKYLMCVTIKANVVRNKTVCFGLSTGLSQFQIRASFYVDTNYSTCSFIGTLPSGTPDNYYFMLFDTNASSDDIVLNAKNVNCIDLTQMFGTAIADLAYSKEQASAGSGIAWLKSYGFFTKDYYPYNTGALQSVKTGSKKVVGKNLASKITSATTHTQYSMCLFADGTLKPSTTYVISFKGTTGNIIYPNEILFTTQSYYTILSGNNILVLTTKAYISKNNASQYSTANQGWILFKNAVSSNADNYFTEVMIEEGSTATSYEPYTSTTYPLDSNLELRGLYKLDTNNNIVCDGDKYTPDGSVKRRYGIVDLGSLSWTKYDTTSGTLFRAFKDDIIYYNNQFVIPNFICSKYIAISSDIRYEKTLSQAQAGSGCVDIVDSSYTDATAFKTAMSGVYLIYELATSTTDSAASYQNPQIIHENGTEEFIDTRDYPLPVGHDTEYFTASDEKFFLPPAVDNNGRFLYHDGDGFQFKNFNQVASKVEESDINGNIKINGTETQVYDDSEIKGELTTDTTTIEGNPLNFTTLSAQTAKSTILSVEPIQDLHGYDKPWVGGAGKNLLPMTVDSIKTLNTDGTWSGNVYTHNNGPVFTILTDSDNNVIGIKANGTFNSYGGTFILYNNSFTAGSYYIRNICSTTIVGGKHTLVVTPDGSSTKKILVETNSGSDIAISAMVYIRMAFGPNITLDNVTFTPLLVKQSVTDYTFEPYTNICPISGRTEIGILGCGKNLFDEDWLLAAPGWTKDSNGLYTGLNTNLYSKYRLDTTDGFPVKFKPNTQYTFSLDGLTSTLNYYVSIMILYTDGTRSDIVQVRATSLTHYTGTSAANKTIAKIGTSFGAVANVSLKNIQVEEATAETTYSPYNKITDLSYDLPETVYGGTLDVESGVLTVDSADYAFTGNETWTAWGTGAYYSSCLAKVSVTNNNSVNVICSEFGVERTVTNIYSGISGVAASGTNIYISSDIYSALSSLVGKKIIYKLATPIIIQLTPHQIKLLKDYNYISSSGSTISLTYRDGQFATLEELSESGVFDPYYVHTDNNYTTEEKTKLGLIDTLAISLDLTNHAIVVTQNV